MSEIEVLLDNSESNKNKISQIIEEINNFGFENSVIKFSVSSSASNKGEIGWINSKSMSPIQAFKRIWKNYGKIHLYSFIIANIFG